MWLIKSTFGHFFTHGFAEAKTHAKTYFRLFFIPRTEVRGYKALTPTEFQNLVKPIIALRITLTRLS